MRAAAVCEPCNNSVSDWLVRIIGNLGTLIAGALGLFQPGAMRDGLAENTAIFSLAAV